MTKKEAEASLVTGGIYQSPYSGAVFKLVEGWKMRSDDSVMNVHTQQDDGTFRDDGFHPYYWYNEKPCIRIDSQQHAMKFESEQKQLPIFN